MSPPIWSISKAEVLLMKGEAETAPAVARLIFSGVEEAGVSVPFSRHWECLLPAREMDRLSHFDVLF